MSPMSGQRVSVRSALQVDLPEIRALMAPFVARGELLPRTPEELVQLLPHAFVAQAGGAVIGFAALEIYSRKLSEIQCLAFDSTPRGPEIVRRVVGQCVQRATQQQVLEVMVVVAPAVEEMLKTCGFEYALPNRKRAMFIRPRTSAEFRADRPVAQPDTRVRIRDADIHDLTEVDEFLAPFEARGEVLRRSEKELTQLLRHAFVAKDEGQIVGFAALEIYSEKLAELQCLAVDSNYRGQGLGRRLVMLCVRRARENRVSETMAITSREGVFRSCGFDDSLPGQKAALFFRTQG